MELRDYLVLVVRNWLIIVVTVAVGLVVAGVMIAVATPMYESKARVVFTAHDVTSGQDLAYAGNYVQSRMQTYKKLATSESVMRSVLEALGSDESATRLAHRTSVEVSQIDTIMTIAVKQDSATGAARAANAVASAVIESVTSIEADHQKVAGSPTVEGVTIGPATPSSAAASPNKPLYLLAGLLVGLLVSVIVVSVREAYQGVGRRPAGEVPDHS